ncbi:hypothetical protein LQG66_22395 [Bradyrhizobium ontarionense]|uniref:Uncharacterized protein n=1 Tax=Bradyrhizobium ontarionense TaxID=2898149 RepID=A0ABY3R424_9BRAD|nr:hypothetical protein [Bradyrhizobium sp. A19]UFZ02050.1 hypothetical protein LQG66_22395 [Bradyrhizobium sp. A19]
MNDPDDRRPILSPFLQELPRVRQPVSLLATVLAVLGGLALLFPVGCVFAMFRSDIVAGGLSGPGLILVGLPFPASCRSRWRSTAGGAEPRHRDVAE